ncbi:UDP-N-acetylglucosamine 2-epimerase [Oryzihumus sp.]
MSTTQDGRLRVAVFVGTRADLGPLSPVLSVLDAAPDVDLHVLTGVAYTPQDLAAAMPRTADGWNGRVHALAEPMRGVSADSMTRHGAAIARGVGQVLQDLGADVLVVLGDRWELLYVVPAAFLLAVPVVHLHGGEVTEGAVDERVRHAVTKLADQHCVASADAAARIRQMGEPPERVHHTGAPGLDRLPQAQALDDRALADLVGSPVTRPVALFTYHPPTAEPGAPVAEWARAAAQATLDRCGTVIATYPGVDEGRDEIISALSALASVEPRFRFVEALGRDYPAVLRTVDVVVGNSSSGIIEAATVHKPVVNIGERQRGRLRGGNVIDVGEGAVEVARGLERALSPEFASLCRQVVNPYGAGDASVRVLDIVRAAPGSPRVKTFVDLILEAR